jgi:branched-chain amino acid aminotransferase
MTGTKIWLNGRLVETGEGRISIFDRGLSFADGLYETLRSYRGRIFALDDHLERLRAGCAMLRLEVPTSVNTWRPRIEEALRANGLGDVDARIRLTVTRGASRSVAIEPGAQVTEIIVVSPVDQPQLDARRRNGIRVRTLSHRRAPGDVLHNIKTLSLLPSVLARFECADAGVDEGLFCNTRGEVCEAITSNVFVVKGKALITPPIDAPCLPGVTRKHLLALALTNGLKAEERAVPIAELCGADEVFTGASVSELAPVVEVDGRTIGSGAPGVVTGQMQELLRAYVMEES